MQKTLELLLLRGYNLLGLPTCKFVLVVVSLLQRGGVEMKM